MIVDDRPESVAGLRLVAAAKGFETAEAGDPKSAVELAAETSFDVVLLHLEMGNGSGLDMISDLVYSVGRPEVIALTSSGDPDRVESAIRHGVWTCLQWPTSGEELAVQIERALHYRRERTKAVSVAPIDCEGIVGESPRIKNALERLALACRNDANILITGETGTGKELFARAIHRNSARAGRSFIVIDCAALPETLIESTLFGHVKGAFTGADQASEGMIREADGGTLFLDEIGELPYGAQKAFLRVLQERRFRPVGGGRETASDFRLIAATNKNLEVQVASGKFREDLLFRVRTFILDLPPLRECMPDLPALAAYYVDFITVRLGIPRKTISPAFLEELANYRWPGNVRELISGLERSILAARHEPTLFPKHLPMSIRIQLARDSVTGPPHSAAMVPPNASPPTTFAEAREATVAEAEAAYLRDLMQRTSSNTAEACRISGLSRSRLYALLGKYGISTANRPR